MAAIDMIVDNREKFNQRKQYNKLDLEKMQEFCKFFEVKTTIILNCRK